MTLLRFCLFLGGLFIGFGQTLAQMPTSTFRNTTLPPNKPTGIVKIPEVIDNYYYAFEYLNSHQTRNYPKDSYEHHLLQLKEQQEKRYGRRQNDLIPNSSASAVGVVTQFDGLPPLFSTPSPDIEVGNDELVVLEGSHLMHVFQMNGTRKRSIPLAVFRDAVQVPSMIYSPDIVYDSDQQCYILSFLSGQKPDNSNLVIAFSITDDPLGNWVVYKYDVNRFDQKAYGSSSKMVIGQNELFITVEMVMDDPTKTWEENQYETRIFQIGKKEGYHVKPLRAKIWRDMIYDDMPMRHLYPVPAGLGQYGPQAYFIATRHSDLRNDTLFLITLTDSLEAEDPKIIYDILRMPFEYQMPPLAAQRSRNTPLQTLDTRVQGAYFHLNQIQFVCSSLDPSTGRSAIYHGIIDSLVKGELSTRAYMVSDPSYYLAYPSIAFAGDSERDTLSLILCHHSASNMYPGLSAFFFRDQYKRPYHTSLNYLKPGQQSVNAPKGSRLAPWAGSSGACRLPKDAKKPSDNIWVVGCYVGIEQHNKTWIAELSTQPLASQRPLPPPVYEQVQRIELDFEVPEEERYLRIALTRENGGVEKLFFKGKVERFGDARFSCFIDDVPPGRYVLVVETSNEILQEKQVIVMPGDN